MKKYKKVVIIVLALLFIIIVIYQNNYVSKYKKERFLENIDAYNTLAEIYYEEYQKHSTRILNYSIIEEGTIHCYDYNSDIKLIEEDTKIAQIALDAFKEGDIIYEICDVYVYDTFVSFCGGDGKESVIYSAKDNKPSYIAYPGADSKKPIIMKITEHWYYAVRNLL